MLETGFLPLIMEHPIDWLWPWLYNATDIGEEL
jgi:hypothetical protein